MSDPVKTRVLRGFVDVCDKITSMTTGATHHRKSLLKKIKKRQLGAHFGPSGTKKQLQRDSWTPFGAQWDPLGVPKRSQRVPKKTQGDIEGTPREPTGTPKEHTGVHLGSPGGPQGVPKGSPRVPKGSPRGPQRVPEGPQRMTGRLRSRWNDGVAIK